MKTKKYTIECDSIHIRYDNYSSAVKSAKTLSNGKTIHVLETILNENEEVISSRIVRIYRNGVQIKPVKEKSNDN